MTVGAAKREIETPALLIDLDTMEDNIEKMARYFSGVKSSLRAHTKTHKSPTIAKKQINAGSRGICCQKLGEAEVMANHGIRDILITSEVVDPEKIQRLVRLARSHDVKVVVDNLKVAKATSEAARRHGVRQGVIVEIDVRRKRCGIMPGEPTVNFVKKIVELEGLDFRGLMGYEGPFFDIPDFEQRKAAAHELLRSLKETVDMVESEGTVVHDVSAGSTSTYRIAGEYAKVTEIEAGSYVFMDSTYNKLEGLDFGCALTVLATIISRPVPERVIVNTGLKAITQEFGMPVVKDCEDAKVYHMSEEHGMIRVDPASNIDVGDKLELIPSHCCTTVNLHDHYYGVRKGKVEVFWPILARGKFQ
jgi:D-serine deaminase-like pyridoxal phosphate-dependent protein